MPTQKTPYMGQNVWCVIAGGPLAGTILSGKITAVCLYPGLKEDREIEFVDVETDEHRLRFNTFIDDEDNEKDPLMVAMLDEGESAEHEFSYPREMRDITSHFVFLCDSHEQALNFREHMVLSVAMGLGTEDDIYYDCPIDDLQPYRTLQTVQLLNRLRLAYGIRYTEPNNSALFRDTTMFSQYPDMMDSHTYTGIPAPISRARYFISEAVLNGRMDNVPEKIVKRYINKPALDVRSFTISLLRDAEAMDEKYREDYAYSEIDFSSAFGITFVDDMLAAGLVPSLDPNRYKDMETAMNDEFLNDAYSRAVDEIIAKMDAIFKEQPLNAAAEWQYMRSIGAKLNKPSKLIRPR